MSTPRRPHPPLRSPERRRGGPAGDWLAGWRLALRMARREVRRDVGRSAFVWLMICLPVAAICASQVILASQDIAPSEFLDQRLGEASARLTWTGIRFEPDIDQYLHAVLPQEVRYATDPLSLAEPPLSIPGWGESLDEQQTAITAWTGQPAYVLTVAEASVDGTGEIVDLLGIDSDAAAVTGMVRLTGGRFPETEDEVLVTPAWTGRGLPATGTITLRGGDAVAVTRQVVGTAEARLDTVIGLVTVPDRRARDRSFLLVGDTPIVWEDAVRFAEHGFETTSRGIAAESDAGGGITGDLRVSYGGVIGTGALLEVALMVGPAFAIGAARQRRALALAASNGASVRHLRRLALGQAVLLGSTAAGVGVALGLGVGAVAWQSLSSDPTQLYGPLEVPLFVAVVLVLGILTALVAALVPTRGLGRLDLVAALRGSARSRPPVKRARWWGLALLVLGLAGTWAGAPLDALDTQVSFAVWFGSLVVTVAGVLLVLPSLLDGVGQLAGSAPVVLRMALRDLGRQRGRATATVAAILGGTLLLGVVWTMVASIDADIARKNILQMPLGQAQAWSNVRTTEGMTQSIASVDPTLRVAVVAESYGVAPEPDAEDIAAIIALRPGCGADILDGDVLPECRSLGNDDRAIFVAGFDDLVWLFDLDAEQQAALREGRILVDTSSPDHPMRVGVNELIDGRLRLGYLVWDGFTHQPRTFDLPAVAVSSELIDRGASSGRFGAVSTTEIAAKYQLALTNEVLRVVDPAGPIGPELEQRLNAAIDDPNWGIWVERGHYRGAVDTYVWTMTAFLALLAVIAAAMATILATAEQRPFLSTFAAVGASPRLNRQVATTQAAVLALLGTLTGVGIGLLAGIPMALSATSNSPVVGPILVIPWQIAAVLVVSTPLVAALVATVCVPARPVLVRRTT